MGVSISMTPGPIGRNFGKQMDIAPGWRSKAASVLREHFREAPFTLTAQQDLSLIRTLEDGASVYTPDEENMWKQIGDALAEHGSITITMDY